MTQSWSDFPVVDTAPDPADYVRLEDVTWGVLYAWTAGPEWVVATSDRVMPEPVRHASEDEDGTLTYRGVPFSEDDEAEVDDDLGRELEMIGLPPRPRGFDWHLRLGKSERGAFAAYMVGRVEAGLPSTTTEQACLNHIHGVMSVLVPEALEHAAEPDA